jgi:peptidoglycan/xylan/chitin deacetylase (PgdA/CDA1 family)
MGKLVKDNLLRILFSAGLFRAWKFRQQNRIIIITLHGVMDNKLSCKWTPLRPQVSIEWLERALSILSKEYRFVSLDDAVNMILGRKPVQPYSMAFTFDDGYRNNLTCGIPVLKQFGARGTMFLTAGHIERRKPFWFDRLDYVLQHAEVAGRRIRVGKESVLIEKNDRDSLRRSYKELRDKAKAEVRDDREMLAELESIAEGLEKECGKCLAEIFECDDWSRIVTWDEVRRAEKDGVDFGSHTVDHIRLGFSDPETIRDQLQRSKKMIESGIGLDCRHFCYPDGSYDGRSAAIVKDCGYLSACSQDPGTNKVGDYPLMLRRISFPSICSPERLLAKVSGLSDALVRGGGGSW